jgi:hypothetical protein
MSATHYSTFLIRRWQLPDQHDRIEIRHIQSGAVGRLDSLGALIEWIATNEQRHEAPPEQQTAEVLDRRITPPAAE